MTKNKYLLFLFLLLQITLSAEELPWFSLNCNLRNANLIVQAEIIDKKGTLKIEKYLRGTPTQKDRIKIEDFAINKKQREIESFPKAKGRKVVVFLVLEETGEIQPSFWSWELSTLWIEDGKYLGVIQMEVPGSYILAPMYGSFEELKIPIDNWLFLEAQIEAVEKITSSNGRLIYLAQLFDWHPFKEAILMRMEEEEDIPYKYMEELVWKIFRYRYLTQRDIYECMWLDYDQENLYQITFRLYKRTLQDKYDIEIGRIIHSYKNEIDYMKTKATADLNEQFVLEFTDFLNQHPPENWEEELENIKAIIEKNKPFYNMRFLGQLQMRIKE